MAEQRVCLTAICPNGAAPDEEHWVLEHVDLAGWYHACEAFAGYVEGRGYRAGQLHAGTADWVRRYADRYAGA